VSVAAVVAEDGACANAVDDDGRVGGHAGDDWIAAERDR